MKTIREKLTKETLSRIVCLIILLLVIYACRFIILRIFYFIVLSGDSLGQSVAQMSMPGFEAVFAITGLLAVAYLIRRKI